MLKDIICLHKMEICVYKVPKNKHNKRRVRKLIESR